MEDRSQWKKWEKEKHNHQRNGNKNREKNTTKEGRKTLQRKIDIDIKTEWTHCIGKRKMIQVRLESWREKEEIMKKESILGENKIFIDHDRTKKERERDTKEDSRIWKERERR